MPDQRVVHRHAATLYGDHGPMQALGQFTPRPMTTQLRFAKAPPEPPQSLAEHIQQAVARVPGKRPSNGPRWRP